MDSVLLWMQSTWLNSLAVGPTWSWPTMEALHFLGLCLLISAIIIMDLRLIGFERAIPVSAIHSLVPLAAIGFGINLITGILFIFGDPFRYAVNIAFQIKMLLLILAGLNALFYYLKVEPMIADSPLGADTPPIAKAVGAASLVLWFGVLVYGRLIPYLGTG